MDNYEHDSDQVFDMIDNIAHLSGTVQQTQIGVCMASDLFVEICKRALDPFTTYGMKKVPTARRIGNRVFSDFTLSLLDRMASRELTGGEANAAVAAHLDQLTEKSQELLTRIIKKDLRAKFSAKSLNRHRPNTVFIFDCMLSQKFEEKRIKEFPVAVEEKYDGVRCLAIVKGSQAKFYSRTGKEFLNYSHIGVQLVNLKALHNVTGPLIFDGEIMDGEFNNTTGSAHRKGVQATTAIYHVFECMSLKEFHEGSIANSYATRRGILETVMAPVTEGLEGLDNLMLSNVTYCDSFDEIYTKNAEIQGRGGEGVIVKPLHGVYEKKRSFNWLKVKACHSADLPIIGTFMGEGKFEGMLGGLIVDFNGVAVRVGSGLTDADRQGLTKIADLEGDIHWPIGSKGELHNRLVEVQYHEQTPDGSLRHPRFVRFRDDKPHEDGHGVAA